MAYAGIAVSCAVLVSSWFWYINKSRTTTNQEYQDLSYSLTVVAMLLLTPICWDHYLLLLAVPLAKIWARLGQSGLARAAFLLIVMAAWADPIELWRIGGVDLASNWSNFHDVPARTYIVHRPLFVLVFLSVHFYALVATYVWLALLARGELASGRRLSNR